MPRKARQKSSTNIYHVVIRGADRQIIFESPKDYKKYLEILKLYSHKLEFEIYAYCLMSNHIHLLIYTPNCSIGSVFSHINTSYAIWFNSKYSRTGHLQQGRFYSEPIEDEISLLSVMRYIHQNPLKAGLETYTGESYIWSSMLDYINNQNSLINSNFILSIIGGIDNFKMYHKYESNDNHLDIHNIIKRIPDDVARDIIFETAHCSSVTEFQNLELLERNKFIHKLHKEKGISVRQLNRLTGIPKGVIDRIVSTKNQDINNIYFS